MNVIEFNNVSKRFKKGEKFNSLRDSIPALFRRSVKEKLKKDRENRDFWAVKDVSFKIKKGEVVGIMGPNGAGKSTILKLLSRIMVPNEGTMNIQGRLAALIEITAGFHPELTGRENVYLNGTILGMKRGEIDERFDEIVEFSGIGEFIDTPVKRYSSGMYSRLGFSVAAHMDPDILLVDEVLSVGDIAFQAKCSQKMRELLKSGKTIVLVSHSLALIQGLCKRAILLQRGKVVMDGNVDDVIPHYQNIVMEKENEDFHKKMTGSDHRVKLDVQTVASISNVTLTNNDRREKGEFMTDETINVIMDYDASERINNPTFFVEIVRADGVSCCASSSRHQRDFIDHIMGKGTVTINLGKLNLSAGIYMVKLSIWDENMIHPFVMRNQDVMRIKENRTMLQAAPIFLPEIGWRAIK